MLTWLVTLWLVTLPNIPLWRQLAQLPEVTGMRGMLFGLGLAFVDKIMALHNGRIDIDSTLGKGSTITLWLPASHDASGRS